MGLRESLALSRWLSPAAGWPAIAARALPFGLYLAFLELNLLLGPLLPDGRWLYAAQIGAVVLALVWFGRRYEELAGWREVRMRHWMWSLGLGIAVFAIWIHLELPGLAFGSTGGFDPTGADGRPDGRLVALRILGAALVVPIMEELFWRSFVLRWIDRADFLRQAPAALSGRAILLGAVPFGLEHNLWFAGILAGIAYGWLYRRCGNLWPAIAAHAVTNLLLGLWVVSTGNWRFW